ncbi:Hypothetical predicted protein [Olea europaea subsp. europaea]|uniref:Uncharacterized protein n=1 Tax=Olea europaea subsp. europaea TaxID=158383 RepID=A0A8S0RLT5_OLEEU|nr:Hypothetical predicted protein [Olea europaea subsp. europaea]
MTRDFATEVWRRVSNALDVRWREGQSWWERIDLRCSTFNSVGVPFGADSMPGKVAFVRKEMEGLHGREISSSIPKVNILSKQDEKLLTGLDIPCLPRQQHRSVTLWMFIGCSQGN